MKAKTVFEEVRFNFKGSPTDRFRVNPGIKREPTENPRKQRSGLNPDEEEIVNRFRDKLQKIQDDIYSLKDERESLEMDLKDLSETPFDSGELEEFYADVQSRYGFNALDILNSGMSDEEKIKSIDALDPRWDFGRREFEDLMHNYRYYHPEDPDQEQVEKIEKRIRAIENVIKEKEGMIDRLETKIYNLENY